MPDTLHHALKNRLARSGRMARCLRDFHAMTGLDCAWVDVEGRTMLTVPRNTGIALCRALRASESAVNACARCKRQAEVLANGTLKPGGCLGGLREVVHPVLVDGQALGHVVLSGYRDPDTGIEEARQAWTRSARGGGTIPWKAWQQAWQQTPELGPDKVSALLGWIELAAADALRRLEEESSIREKDQVFPAHVHKACQLVREQYDEPLKVGEIAASFGISPEHFSRLFHQSTGLRFRDYLTETRLNRACEYLATTNDRVADIAERVGYSTLSRFNRGFLAHTGMTPTAWRRRKRVVR